MSYNKQQNIIILYSFKKDGGKNRKIKHIWKLM